MRVKLCLHAAASGSATAPDSTAEEAAHLSTTEHAGLSHPIDRKISTPSNHIGSGRTTRSALKPVASGQSSESAHALSGQVTPRSTRLQLRGNGSAGHRTSSSDQIRPSTTSTAGLSTPVPETLSIHANGSIAPSEHSQDSLQRLLVGNADSNKSVPTRVKKFGYNYIVTGVNWSESIPFPVTTVGDLRRAIQCLERRSRPDQPKFSEHATEIVQPAVTPTELHQASSSSVTSSEKDAEPDIPAPSVKKAAKPNFQSMGTFGRGSLKSSLGKRKITQRSSLSESDLHENDLPTDDETDTTQGTQQRETRKTAKDKSIKLKMPPNPPTNILRLQLKKPITTANQTESHQSTSAGGSEEDAGSPIALTPRKRRRYPSIRLQDLS